VAIDRKLYTLTLPYSNITFRATFIKLYLTLLTKTEGIKVILTIKLVSKELISKEFTSILNTKLIPLLVKRNKGQLHKNLYIIIFLQDN
jgi:hypothetical protein